MEVAAIAHTAWLFISHHDLAHTLLVSSHRCHGACRCCLAVPSSRTASQSDLSGLLCPPHTHTRVANPTPNSLAVLQVVSFGSTFEHLAAAPIRARDYRGAAQDAVAGATPTWGATNLWSPLKVHPYTPTHTHSPPTPTLTAMMRPLLPQATLDRCRFRTPSAKAPPLPTNIVVVTDGQLGSSRRAVQELVKAQASACNARLFVLGVGSQVNKHVCK